MKKHNLASLLLSLTLLAPCAASAAQNPEFKGTTTLLSETSVPLSPGEARAFFMPGQEDERFVVTGALVVMAGLKAWNVIVNGRPTANLASAYASAIPGFQFEWNDLQDWKKVTKKYRFTMDNFLQGRAVDIVYEVSFFHGSVPIPGGQGKKGSYIANFTVKPLDINLKWGWKVSLQTAMSDPMNIGTAAEPTAWLNADLKWQYTKPFSTKPEINMNSLSVDGLGRLTETTYGEMAVPPVPVEESREPLPAISWN